MARKPDCKAESTPQVVNDQLAAMMYQPHSHITVFVVCLALASPLFWDRSHDPWIVSAMVLGVVLNLGRMGALHASERHSQDRIEATGHWTVLHLLGGAFALSQALLVTRAFFLGDAVLTVLAVLSVATYTIGLIVRGSAVPRLAIPHLLLLFAPLVLVSACSSDTGFLAVSGFLSAGCLACVKLSLDLHRRLKSQLIAEYQLARASRTDFLTGLANRAGFEAHAQARFAADATAKGYVILGLIDLDGFKAVNDTYGHGAGDALLKEVAGRILSVLANEHLCARLGGDEFAIVFDRGTQLDHATGMGEALVRNLQRPFIIDGTEMKISASIGIATSDNRDSLRVTLEHADNALYQAKNAGRNQIRLYQSPELKAA